MQVDLAFVHTSGEPVVVRIVGRNIYFAKVVGGQPVFAPLEGLKLSIAGIVKEHPDLEGKPIGEIKAEGLRRFKEHINKFSTTDEIINYLKDDLAKHGYKMIRIDKAGFRPIKVRG